MDCFENLISVRGLCEEVVPQSGIYLDDIGIPLSVLDEIVTADYASSADLYSKKLSFASKLIANQIYNHLSDRYLANSVIDGQRVGYFQNDLKLIAGTLAVRKGINFELHNYNSYLDLFISEISIQLNYSGAVSIKVYDLITTKLIDTIAATADANNIVTVYPAKSYRSNKKRLNLLFVINKVVDDSSNEIVISANTTSIWRDGSGCTTCGGQQLGVYKNSWLAARAVTIPDASTKIKANLSSSADTGGLSIVYSLNCNHQDWLCNIAQQIALPLAYKTGAELMGFAEDVSSSERVNTYVFANGDKIPTRKAKYEFSYAQAMDNVLQNLQVPQDTNCFECNKRSINKIILP